MWSLLTLKLALAGIFVERLNKSELFSFLSLLNLIAKLDTESHISTTQHKNVLCTQTRDSTLLALRRTQENADTRTVCVGLLDDIEQSHPQYSAH